MSYFGKKTIVVAQESSYGTNRVYMKLIMIVGIMVLMMIDIMMIHDWWFIIMVTIMWLIMIIRTMSINGNADDDEYEDKDDANDDNFV